MISSIRQLSKAAMKEDSKPSKDNEDAFYNSQKFEVLYCGRVIVTHKKAPSSLIDDCKEKFSLHEQQRLRLQGEKPGDPGDELGVFEAESPVSPDDILLPEKSDGAVNSHHALPSLASQPTLASSRVCFPERILEDCGFDEQQEFRSRCSSVTGVRQKVHDNSQKPQPRRRHASAPSHVQPSDSEKNRTMLFQVAWQGVFGLQLLKMLSNYNSSLVSGCLSVCGVCVLPTCAWVEARGQPLGTIP